MVRVICPLLKKKNVIFDFVYRKSIICSTKSAPNLVKIFMSNKIWMNSIMGPIGPEQLELFVLELGKIASFDFVYSSIYKYKPISTKIGHNEYEHRSQMSLIMGQVIPDQWVLSALEIEKLNFSSLFGIYLLC